MGRLILRDAILRIAPQDEGLVYSAATLRAPRTPVDRSRTSDATASTVPDVARLSLSSEPFSASTSAVPTTTPSACAAMARAFSAVLTPKPTDTGSFV